MLFEESLRVWCVESVAYEESVVCVVCGECSEESVLCEESVVCVESVVCMERVVCGEFGVCGECGV